MTTPIDKHKILALEPRCILCHTKASWCDAGLDERDLELFFCFEDIRSYRDRDENTKCYIFRSSGKGSNALMNAFTDGRRVIMDAGVIIFDASKSGCELLRDGDLRAAANVIHAPCLQLAKQRVPNLSARSLCHFAQTTRAVTTRFEAANASLSRRAMPRTSVPFSNLGPTNLGSLLRRISQLPLELQSHMFANLWPGLFSSLAICLQSISWMEEFSSLVQRPPRAELKRLVPPAADVAWFSFLGANTISILGEACLTQLGIDPSVSYEHTIPISDPGRAGEILGVHYTLGRGGIRGIRLQYRDRSFSPWLGGNAASGWIYFAPVTQLQSLVWQSDGTKALAISDGPIQRPMTADDSSDSSDPSPIGRLFWDHDLRLSPGSVCRILDLSLNELVAIRYHPNTRYARYLALNKNHSDTHSLTVFSSAVGVNCLQQDGDWKHRLGNPTPQSCAVTFYLEAGETVQSIYIVTRRSRNIEEAQGPFLLVKTSRGRFLYYGTHIMPLTPITQAHISAFGYEETHTVSGVFIDPMLTIPGALNTIGVVLEPRQQIDAAAVAAGTGARPLVTVRTPERLGTNLFLSSNPWTAFISYSTFAGVRLLRMQKIMQRCVGLLAEFGPAAVPVTAGQWDPSNGGAISTLYDAERDGPLRSLTFIYSGETSTTGINRTAPTVFVLDIVPNIPSRPEGDHCHWDDFSMELAWSFTFQYDFLEVNVTALEREHVVEENAVPCETVQ